MKKSLLKLIIFLAIVGVFNIPSITHAQTEPKGSCNWTTGTEVPRAESAKNVTKAECKDLSGSVLNWTQNAPGTPDGPKQINASTAATAPNLRQETCGFTNPIGCIAWIILVIMRLLSLITLLAGAVLNYVIMYTIVDMSKHYSEIGAIKTSWSTIRDLANMTFIFILLYQAIKTIIGEGKETQQFVVKMIIAALLMNFSLFFTQLIIDASNILTLTFYKAIVVNYSPDDLLSSGLSNSIMQPLNLQTIWKASDGLTGTNLVTIGVLGSIFTLIAAFVFFAIALLFIIRYVVLIFVLIFSPIFVVGSIIPGMKDYADDWKKALTGQVTFAPIYMILTWVVIKIFNSGGIIPTTGSFGNLSNASLAGSVGNIALIVNFIVIIAFLIATLLISKSLSESSSKYLSPLTNWAMSKAGGASFGLAGRLGRGTVGAVGQRVADSQFLKERAPESRMARLALSAGKKTGAASFDMRATGLNKQLGAGEAGGRGGYKADREKIIKDRMAQAGEMADVITGDHVENEMERLGYSKAENRRLNRSASEVERVRREAQERLLKGSEQETARRQELFLHNMSQTRFRTPNLYSGVSTDAEAARRLRPKQPKVRTREEEERAQRMREAAEAFVAAGGVTPAPTPPTTPPTP